MAGLKLTAGSLPSSDSLSSLASLLFEAATIAIAIVVAIQWSRGKFGETL